MSLTLTRLLAVLTFLACRSLAYDFPKEIYGVNLGSWLVLEPWMLPQEWIDMGGDPDCGPCSDCIRTEFAFTEANPGTADEAFDQHWSTWFNQDDVDHLKQLGINTVRIPLGYWIVEPLVDRKTEFYPRGGLKQLRRGLQQLQAANIPAILDHHAAPGVQAVQQMFTGRCTDDPQFYTPYNYHRALVWAAVMTALSHLDPAFEAAVSIEAVNEPIMNATMTPGYGEYQKNFVRVVRAVELGLGVRSSGGGGGVPVPDKANLTEALAGVGSQQRNGGSGLFNDEVRKALVDAVPMLLEIAGELDIDEIAKFASGVGRRKDALITMFMDVNWQNSDPPNPADAAIGPQYYDNHLYYSFGGVADPNPDAYLTSICNLQRVQDDAKLGNKPLVFGEWGLPTQFDATDEFLMKWADAQKLAYVKGAGWIFWNFKIEISELAGDLARQWSYFEGVRRGYLTNDPAEVHDRNVCAPYVNGTSTNATSSP